MPYDWSTIENEQKHRAARNFRPLGLAWVAIGLISSVAAHLTGHSEKLIGMIGWLVIGLVFYLGSRRHAAERRDPAKSQGVEASADDRG